MNSTRARSVVLALAATAALASCGSGDEAGTSADGPASQTPSETTSGTLELTADSTTAGKCAVPNADTLSTADTAFAGTVTSLAEGTATLSVDQWYAGDEASTVTVATPAKDLQDLLMAVDFEQGKTYLVSANDGRVTLCGFTAEKTPDLEAIYAEAFPG